MGLTNDLTSGRTVQTTALFFCHRDSPTFIRCLIDVTIHEIKACWHSALCRTIGARLAA